MIPKLIHLCWLSGDPYPEKIKYCIDSWKKYLPDYEIMLWDTKRFDVNSTPWTKQAFEAKKYAFVSDYVRLFALYSEGGIYMDTDVEVIKAYDDLLSLDGFIGYEGTKHHPLGTGTIASVAGGEWVREQLHAYDQIHFLQPDGTYDLTTNPVRITSLMRMNGFVQNGKEQDYKDMHVFPVDYFCPRQTTGEYLLTDNTYCDHHFTGLWNESSKGKLDLTRLLGQQCMTRLIKFKRKIFG